MGHHPFATSINKTHSLLPKTKKAQHSWAFLEEHLTQLAKSHHL